MYESDANEQQKGDSNGDKGYAEIEIKENSE